MIEPHYPRIIFSFAYRDCIIEIDRDELDGQYVYAAWVKYDKGYAMAVPMAINPKDAVKKAKTWIDKRFTAV